jgi:hypothetical protein
MAPSLLGANRYPCGERRPPIWGHGQHRAFNARARNEEGCRNGRERTTVAFAAVPPEQALNPHRAAAFSAAKDCARLRPHRDRDRIVTETRCLNVVSINSQYMTR